MASIKDMLVRQGTELAIDLRDVFGQGAGSFAVTNSAGETVASSIVDGVLTLDFNALGHSDLVLNAVDANGAAVSDKFRVQVAGENAYTIAVLPDTQDYTNAANVAKFEGMTRWLVDNKESLGIQFAIHVGDITTNNNDANHWSFAEPAIRILDGQIPYSLLPGNHDQNTGNAANHSTNPLDTRFSPTKQKETNPDTFGGVYDQEPTRSANNYHTFTAPDGTKWMVLSLEFGPRDDVIRWADGVIEDHLDHRVILANHSYMNWAGRHDATGAPLYDEGTGYDYGMGNLAVGANDGETMYRELIQKHSNVSFTFSGHIFGDGAETLTSFDQFGNPVQQMMVNYQNGVASEITGNSGAASGGAGGNGAIRLLTIDPENGNVYTSTYFSALDDYLDTPRGDGELDRDGLTGPYRGHQETITGMELGTPEQVAIAKAGDDLRVKADEGADTADVTLDASGTLNPGSDNGLSYRWIDTGGQIVAQGATPTVSLGAGHHALRLEVEDGEGRISTDDILVIVSTDDTLLVDDFNDGNANGWSAPVPTIAAATGTTASFGIAALPGADATTEVTFIPKLGQTQILKIASAEPIDGNSVVSNYSLVYDLLVPANGGTWFSFLQTGIENTTDQDLAMQNRGNGTGGIGIASDYEGTFNYGQWHRVAFTVADQGTSVLITKYIDGVNVGTTTQSGGNYARYPIDIEKGFLLFSDESGDTSNGYVSSVLFADTVLTGAEITAFGSAKAGGITDTAPTPRSVQIDFSDPTFPDSFDFAAATLETNTPGGLGSFLVKGSAATRPVGSEGEAAPEGRLYQQSDSADNILVWNDPAARNWSDYVFEATLKSTDNDEIGVVFHYQDAGNHYRFVMDGETNTRALVKVEGSIETVLESVSGGTPWSRDMHVKIAVADGEIDVFLDGKSVFGTVVDAEPLTNGTVGFYSSDQRSSQFDNVAVNPIKLSAHAGDDTRTLDLDGNGRTDFRLDAEGSYGLDEIVSFRWTDEDGEIVAETRTADVTLANGRSTLTLTVTDQAGGTASDTVVVEGVASDRILLSDSFADAGALARWRIVDEGESGGIGVGGTRSLWEIEDGALTQQTSLKSRQLEWNGASNADVWKTGWSPLGDGVYVLRKGTYALHEDEAALDWKNYAFEATVETPDDGALGMLFYYQDAENYYKLELDASGDYDRTPGNGAGSLFQLIQMKGGVERYLNQMPAKYTPNEAFQLRVEVLDGKIQAFVDGDALFAYAIEDRAHEGGTVGLFSWDSAGVSFDDVTVVSFAESALPPVTPPGGGGNPPVTPPISTGPTIGPDLLAGTPGNDDPISGGFGNDTINAGAGNDLVFGNQDDDQLFGNEGNDTVYGGQGADSVYGGQGNDEAYGNLGNDVVYANKGDDRVFGNEGDDQVFGNEGNDVLHGGQGDDSLYGGQDNDSLNGGAGDDILFGGLGSDVFVFVAGQGDDTVGDFDREQGDVLDLQGQSVSSVGMNADGDAVLSLSGGGTITLLGAAVGEFALAA